MSGILGLVGATTETRSVLGNQSCTLKSELPKLMPSFSRTHRIPYSGIV